MEWSAHLSPNPGECFCTEACLSSVTKRHQIIIKARHKTHEIVDSRASTAKPRGGRKEGRRALWAANEWEIQRQRESIQCNCPAKTNWTNRWLVASNVPINEAKMNWCSFKFMPAKKHRAAFKLICYTLCLKWQPIFQQNEKEKYWKVSSLQRKKGTDVCKAGGDSCLYFQTCTNIFILIIIAIILILIWTI